jgi:ligand-binding sensor domain-containing protein
LSEVLEVNLKRAFALISVALVSVLIACKPTTVVEPPPPGPQITTVASYTTAAPTDLPNNDVFSILVTAGGQVWMGGESGLRIYPSVTATKPTGDVINEINGLPNPYVRAAVEYNGRIYIATWGGGIGIYDEGTQQWSSKQAGTGSTSLIDNHVSDAVLSTAEDRIYFATNQGVSIYDPTAGTFSNFVNLGPDLIVSSIEVRNDNGTFERWYGPRYDTVDPGAASGHGITVSRGSNVYRFTTSNSPLPEPRVNDIFYDNVRDVFWVAFVTAGIAEVSVTNSTWTFYTTVQGLPSNTVYSITRANDDVWAGTQGGLARLKDNGHWQAYSRSAGLQSDRVRVVYTDDGSRLWLGFVEGGAARVNPASAQ